MARLIREGEIIELIRRSFPGADIGDDTAVLASPRGELLFASDAVVEGVHFLRGLSTPAQAVQKAVTSNVSDIYAMGGTPTAIVCSAGIPPRAVSRDVEGIIEGLTIACRHFGIRLAGGDTVLSPGGYFFDIAIVGSVPKGRAIRRAGAKPGDAICLFGAIGASLAGLAVLSALHGLKMPAGVPAPSRDAVRIVRRMRSGIRRLALGQQSGGAPRTTQTLSAAIAHCIRKHLVPDAAALAPALLRSRPPRITAMIDVSDGLAKDLRTLCTESGVGAVIDVDALPLWQPLGEIFPLKRGKLVEIAVASGEEYVLLATIRSGSPPVLGGVSIGEVVHEREGLTLVGPRGERKAFPRGGYEHAF